MDRAKTLGYAAGMANATDDEAFRAIVSDALQEIRSQNRRLMQQNEEILQFLRGMARGTNQRPPPGSGPAAPAKVMKKKIGGKWHVWGGEGTGWVEWMDPSEP